MRRLSSPPGPEPQVVSTPAVYEDRTDGIQAPGRPAIITAAGRKYLAILNSGSNKMLIYTLGSRRLADADSEQSYATGTNPVGLTVTTAANDLNGDAVPDIVVANEGSNDVSVFLGKLTSQGWELDYRPRQSSGGIGPSSVAVADVIGAGGVEAPDGIPDLLVSNSQSNDVSVLANRGDGFFINSAAGAVPPLLTGVDPREVLVGNFDTNAGLDLATVNAGSNDVTLIANFLIDPSTSTISSGGTLPQAAVVGELNGANILFVANAGNGVVEMLTGTFQGFEVLGTLAQTAAPHLSDLAVVTVGNGFETVSGQRVGTRGRGTAGDFRRGAAASGAAAAGPWFSRRGGNSRHQCAVRQCAGHQPAVRKYRCRLVVVLCLRGRIRFRFSRARFRASRGQWGRHQPVRLHGDGRGIGFA